MKTEESIRHLRLLNGDEIIGELIETTNDQFLISKPMVVSEKEDPNTNISTIMLSKYVLFEGEEAIPFQKNHVITCTAVLPEIKKYYYNSVEFNSRFSEPVIRKEISRINNLMENMLKEKNAADVMAMAELDEDDTEPKSIKIYLSHQSNTIH